MIQMIFLPTYHAFRFILILIENYCNDTFISFLIYLLTRKKLRITLINLQIILIFFIKNKKKKIIIIN